MRLVRILSAAVASLAIAVVPTTAMAAPSAEQAGVTRISVYHQPTSPTATSGTGIGEVRTFTAPIAVDGVAADGQYFTGTLTTLATGLKGNQELRASNLIFVFGDEANQLVVGGISLYPAAGATIAPGARTVRPVVGGSGTYAGATGQVVTTNLGADGWSHVFLIRVP